MSWVSKILGKTTEPSTTRRVGGGRSASKIRRQRKLSTKTIAYRYRSAAIHCNASTACEPAKRISGKKFLASHVPQLPLGGCTNAPLCQCRYRYHVDRRQELRRDADHGLPSAGYVVNNRRARSERRKPVE